MSSITVLVADSRRLFAEALGEALALADGIEVIPEHPRHGRAVVEAAERHRPAVVILDYWMPGMRGPGTIRWITRRVRETRVLCLAWFHGAEEVREAMRAGAAAFIPRSIEIDELIGAIHQAAALGHTNRGASPSRDQAGESLREPAGRIVRGQMIPASRPATGLDEEGWERLSTLTDREIDVLSLLAFRPVPDVARILGISVVTVRNHIQHILEKTGCKSQIEAVGLARRFGVV